MPCLHIHSIIPALAWFISRIIGQPSNQSMLSSVVGWKLVGECLEYTKITRLSARRAKQEQQMYVLPVHRNYICIHVYVLRFGRWESEEPLFLVLLPRKADMDLSLDFRVAGIALTKKIHFGIQKLSNPDERPRRFFREVSTIITSDVE